MTPHLHDEDHLQPTLPLEPVGADVAQRQPVDSKDPPERKRKLSEGNTEDIPSKRPQKVSPRPTMNTRGDVSKTTANTGSSGIGLLHGIAAISDEPVTRTDSDTAGRGSPGFFQNSHDLMIMNSTMVNTQEIYINERSSEALPWLLERVIPGIEFDSAERDPPPRCQPGTRVQIIQTSHEWLSDPKREKKVLWVRGPAGSGKSAIVQTLVEDLAEDERLGAGVFFSGLNKRNDPNQVFPTLAYQLAVRDAAYRSYVGNLMLANPMSLCKAMNEQFRLLFVEPFARQRLRDESKVCVIALDGLDECDGTDQQGRSASTHPPGHHSDRSQCEIVQLISSFASRYPEVPLLWIISSRPEPHLQAVFSTETVRSCTREVTLVVDSDEAQKDVERFLHSKFSEIRQQYPEFMPIGDWPSKSHFFQIARAASGLFAVAAIITRFIDDPSIGNPIDRTNRALIFLSNLKCPSGQDHPLVALDAIYIRILSKLSPSSLEAAKQLVAAAFFYDDEDIPHGDLITVCNLLGITRANAIAALRHLPSVMQIPHKTHDFARTRLHCHHISFRNFLEDSSRSGKYCIEDLAIGIQLFWASFRIAQAIGSRNTGISREEPPVTNFHGISLSWPDEGDPITLARLRSQLTLHALEAWECLLHGEFLPSGLILKYHTIAVSVPDDEFQAFLNHLSITKILEVSSQARSLLSSLHWNKKNFKDELTKRRFLTTTTLGSLGISKDISPESTTTTVDGLLNFVQIHLDKKPSHQMDAETLAIHQYSVRSLLRDIQTAPDTPVTILGAEDTDRCAISRVWDSYSFESTTYFITGFNMSNFESHKGKRKAWVS